MSRLIALALAIASGLLAGAAPADAQTLQRIKESGTIRVGHRESSVPFAYYDANKQVIGYSIDIVRRIVAALERDLGLSKIEIKWVPVNTENRMALIQDGTIDIECGSTSNTLERQSKVAFSNSIFVVGTRLLTRRNSGIEDFNQLTNKTVAVTANTNAEKILKAFGERTVGMRILVAKDHDESFALVDSGQAVAFMMDDALLHGAMARSANPRDWAVVGLPRSREAYGCMLPRKDAPYKKLVDTEIARIMQSGEGEQLFVKWFQSPVPPNGINFNIPMTDETRAWMRKPNDLALDAMLPHQRPTSLADHNCFRSLDANTACRSGQPGQAR